MPDDTTLKAGIDYTVLFGGYASALNQGFTYAEPDATKGFVNYQDAQPPTSGGILNKPLFYEQYKRYLWVSPSTGVTKAYSQTAGQFINVASLIPDGTITSLMLKPKIIDGVIHFINPPGIGAKGFTWLINNTGDGWVLADPIFSKGPGTIPVNLLQGSTVVTGDTENLQFLRSNKGVTEWGQLTGNDVNLALKKGERLDLNVIGTNENSGGPGMIPMVNEAGTFLFYQDPALLLKEGAVPIDRLMGGGVGNKGKYIRVREDGKTFEYHTQDVSIIPTVQPTTLAPLAIPNQGGVVQWAHGNTTIPGLWSMTFVCIADYKGWVVGEEAGPAAFGCSHGTDGDRPTYPLFYPVVDATNFSLYVANTDWVPTLLNKTTRDMEGQVDGGVTMATIQASFKVIFRYLRTTAIPATP